MPSSNIPPEEQTSVKPFDPLVLDRTVIAVPLRKEMKDDLDLMKKVEEKHPGVFQEFNSVIEFDSDFPGGVKDAQEKVVAMAEEAKQAALKRSARRVQEAA